MAKVITLEMVKRWKQTADDAKGTSWYAIFNMEHQYRDDCGRWHFCGWDNVTAYGGGRWEIKTVKDRTYLMWTYLRDGSAERWILTDLAKKYFLGGAS